MLKGVLCRLIQNKLFSKNHKIPVFNFSHNPPPYIFFFRSSTGKATEFQQGADKHIILYY